MRDRGVIFAGLLVFLTLITFPVWYNFGAGMTPRVPALKLPVQERECVAPISYMKTSHMTLLTDWRDSVVRRNVRTYEAYNGRIYAISLSGTCLQQCLSDMAGFCDRCHKYNGVGGPYCWDCHLDPQLPDHRQASVFRAGEQDGR
jgi:hypothetical protein